jgi:iron complex outermembrane receptor protein
MGLWRRSALIVQARDLVPVPAPIGASPSWRLCRASIPGPSEQAPLQRGSAGDRNTTRTGRGFMTLHQHRIGTRGPRLKPALLAGVGLAMAIGASGASAADQPAAAGVRNCEEVVVTGSRIARRDYTATSPIVTVDTALVERSSAVNLEANLNKLPQFAPALTQFGPPEGRGDINSTATNTPGATTVSLRQLGANRNLVLIDGRRPTPINGTGVVDINSVPSAAIDRVEIITGGASSTYGADAVGGVVNFILKKNYKGFTVDGQVGVSEEGDGREYRIATLIGANLEDGRGNVMIGLERYDRAEVKQFDRQAYRDLYSSPDTLGNTIFGFEQSYVLFPAGTAPTQSVVNSFFQAKGAPATNPSGAVLNIPTAGGIYFNTSDNSLFLNTSSGTGANYVPLLIGYKGAIDGVYRKKTAAGLLRDNYADQMLSTPLGRWSFFARGHYDLNEYISVFTQANFVKTKVFTRNLVPPAITSWGVLIPYGTGTYTGDPNLGIASSVLSTDPLSANFNKTNPDYMAGGKYGLACGATGGCTNSQVFPVPSELATLLNARGANSNTPWEINTFLNNISERLLDNRNTTFQVTFGLNGTVPGQDWTWEVYGSHGETTAKTDQYNFASVLRWRAVMGSPNYGKGFQYKGNSGNPGGGFQGATGKCTTGVSPFVQTPWSDDCKLAVTTNLQTENRNIQDIVEANIQGGLWRLPYGQLRFALGADYRKNSISFRPDSSSTEGASFLEPVNGIYPQGATNGQVEAKEVYGELLIPILSELPFAKLLNVEAGYRLSNYSLSTVGTVSTYKINGEYSPIDFLRFRGGYQKASRAPNLAELYTAATSTLGTSNDGDPCSRANPANPIGIGNYSANPIGKDSDLNPLASDTVGNPDASSVESLCRQIMGAQGASTYYTAGRTYSTVTAGLAFPTLLGNPDLKQEDATTYTVGAVITSPLQSPWLRRLNLAVDYYHVDLKNAISQQGIDGVYRRCFAKQYNPTFTLNQYCALIGRTPATGEVAAVSITYSNAGRVRTSGIDAQMNWALDFMDAGIGLPGVFTANITGNYLLNFETTTDDGIIPLVDYAGSLGGGQVGTNAGAYRWKVFSTFTYAVGPATMSLQWQYKSSAASVISVTDKTSNTTGAPSYHLFNVNGTYAVLPNATLRFGVDNLFNRAPPLITVNNNATSQGGNLKGGTYDSANYDVLGRRFFVGVNMRF